MLHLLTPLFLPIACAWIERQQRIVLAQGLPLSDSECGDARTIGVRAPERVRLLEVARIPLPAGRIIRAIARATGLLAS